MRVVFSIIVLDAEQFLRLFMVKKIVFEIADIITCFEESLYT